MKWKFLSILMLISLCAGYFTVQTFASQAPPPVFGCLGLGGQQCSFIQVSAPQINMNVNGKPLKGKKIIVHYGDTVTGSVSYVNTGSLPLNISKVGVAAKKSNYEVFFTPSQGKTVLAPGQSIHLTTTSHKFNYPDPPGDWTLAGRVVNEDNQSVDGNNPDSFTLVADCTPLRAIDPTNDADKLNQYCQGKTDDALCKEFCEVKPDLAKNCATANPDQPNQPADPNQNPGQAPDPQNPNPDGQNPDQQTPDEENPEQPDQEAPVSPQPDQPVSPQPDQEEPISPGPSPAEEQEQNNDNQNIIEQVQQQFQKFLDDLAKLFNGQ